MFYLTVATSSATVSSRPPLSAPDALRTWQAEEARGLRVICLDQDHNLVTKRQLRELAAQAHRGTKEGPADALGLAATLARVGMGNMEAVPLSSG